MWHVFLVFLGGGLGALGRWGFTLVVTRWFHAAWPLATFGVNVLGGFAIGFIAGHLIKSGNSAPISDGWRLFLVTGLLGGFTTFSAFSLETAKMIEAGDLHSAVFYSLASVVLCVVAVFAGMVLGRLNV
jgi:fluoride exporter